MKRYPKLFIFLSIVIFSVNLIQALFTDIIGDEAYYWLYSTKLEWVYYDHPPMIALMVKMGYLLFHNALGVRLVTVIFSFFSFYLLWELIEDETKNDRKSIFLYFLIYLSIPVFNIYGFISTPDAPLLFFTLIYILVYFKFEKNPNQINTLLTGVMFAFLLYSKYHGILVIFATVISNIKLLKRKAFWIAGFIGILLFIPHMIRQYELDFPTFRYHLMERNTEFKFKNIYDYILNVIVILNPFIIFYFLYKKKTIFSSSYSSGKFFNTLFWTFIIFFFISSIKGHVEPHWINVACIPFVLFIYEKAKKFPELIKGLNAVFYFTIAVFMLVRIALIFDFIPYKNQFHGQKEKMLFIKEKSAGLPVVFLCAYANTSLYSYYTGDVAYSSNVIWGRKNQYDLWNMEESYNDQKVFMVSCHHIKGVEYTVYQPGDTLFYNIYDHYITADKIEMYSIPELKVVENNKQYRFKLHIKNEYSYEVHLIRDEFSLRPVILIMKNNKLYGISLIKTELPTKLDKKEEVTLEATALFTGVPKGNYTYYISFLQKNIPPLFNSKAYDIEFR